MIETSVDFALLAPVPREHLDGAQEIADSEGFVAFGSMKWELFRQLDTIRNEQPVPVLIYPSHEGVSAKLTFTIAWTGWYIGHVEAVGGAHPDGMKHRPKSMAKYANDVSGYWAVFWHVKDLKPLPEDEHQPISSLKSHASSKYRLNAPPRGPEIVARPVWI